MPKSKNNRKNGSHKKKVNAFKNKMKERQNAYKKEYIRHMNELQQVAIDAQLAKQQEDKENEVVNIDGIDLDDMQID